MGPITPPVPKSRNPLHPPSSWHRSRFPLQTPPKNLNQMPEFPPLPSLPARSPLCDLGGGCAGQGLAPRSNPTRSRDGFASDVPVPHLQEGDGSGLSPNAQGTSAPVFSALAVPPPQSHTLFKVQRLPSTCCSEQIKGRKITQGCCSGGY